MPTKRIVCLANSRKLNGRCVAGKELTTAGQPVSWVRPVSARDHEEVSEYERQYPDGSDPNVGDIMHVPLLHHKPRDYQVENWLLDPQQYWERASTASWTELAALTDSPPRLWTNEQSTYNGMNDEMSVDDAKGLSSSLYLVRVHDLVLHVFAPGSAFGNGKRRVQGRFSYNGDEYHLWVTDPRYEKHYLAMSNGEHSLGQCLLTISLGEPYQGMVYKLIAAVIQEHGVSA